VIAAASAGDATAARTVRPSSREPPSVTTTDPSQAALVGGRAVFAGS
jgi:hypothetical protein